MNSGNENKVSKKEANPGFIRNKNQYEGLFFSTKKWGILEVVRYMDNKNVVVRFITTGTERSVSLQSIQQGDVKDWGLPTVYGVGILGLPGVCKTMRRAYKVWTSILFRSYVDEKRADHLKTSLSDEWIYFPNFLEWYNDNYVEGWELDKDLLGEGSRIYSKDTCAFLPREVNQFLVVSKGSEGEISRGFYYNHERNKYVTCFSIKKVNYTHKGFETAKEAQEEFNRFKKETAKHYAEKYRYGLSERAYNKLVNFDMPSYTSELKGGVCTNIKEVIGEDI